MSVSEKRVPMRKLYVYVCVKIVCAYISMCACLPVKNVYICV